MSNLLREYIRELITESIDPKIMSMIDELESMGGSVIVLPDRVVIAQDKSLDGKWPSPRRGYLAAVVWEDPGFGITGPCDGANMVSSSFARKGLGPLAYDVAIELTGNLMPDRYSVSKPANKVWDRYMNNRPDIQVSQLDNDLNDLTPENEDNCAQDSAEHDARGWSQPGEFWNSSLSKVYRKTGTPVIDELRKRGMLEER